MKKIIIIGAGHGGIITSSILSKNGFDITIYEKTKKIIWAMIGKTYLT